MKFKNPEATPQEVIVAVGSGADAVNVIDWYSAFNAGDPYNVYINGIRIDLDDNGQVKDRKGLMEVVSS
jgi:hypothetical protein